MKTRQFIMAFGALALLAGCTEKAELRETPEYSDGLIRFQSVVSKVTAKSAFAQQTFTGGRDSLYIVADHIKDGVRSTYFGETAFYGEGGVWRADKYWPIGGEIDFLAYYTTGNRSVKDAAGDTLCATWGVGEGDSALKLVMTVSGNYTPLSEIDDSVNVKGNQMDFLYAYSNGNVPLGQVPLVFHHANTWVNFTIRAKQDSVIVLDSIVFHNTAYDGVFTLNNSVNVTEAKWVLGETGDVSFPGVKKYLVPDTVAVLGDGFVLPEQDIRNFTLHYSILTDRSHQGYVYDFNMERGLWERGKKYTYNISLNGIGEIEVTPSVDDWDSESGEYNEPECITIGSDSPEDYELAMDMTGYNVADPDTVWTETKQVYGFTGTLSVASSNERVATAEVSASGEITFTGKADGVCWITVTDSGTKTSKAVMVTVENGPAYHEIIFKDTLRVAAVDTLIGNVGDTLVVTVRGVEGGLNAVSTDPNIATCAVTGSNLNESTVEVYLKKAESTTTITLTDGKGGVTVLMVGTPEIPGPSNPGGLTPYNGGNPGTPWS